MVTVTILKSCNPFYFDMYTILSDKDYTLTPEIFCDGCNANTVQKQYCIGNGETICLKCGNKTQWTDRYNEGHDL